MDDTREVLFSNTDVNSDKSGIISIDVTDRDPQRAADVANAYARSANRIVARIQSGDAAQKRSYFEGEVAKASKELSEAEARLQKVQERTGVVDLSGRLSQALTAE